MRELVGTYTKEYRQFEAALAELAILPPTEVAELLEQRERGRPALGLAAPTVRPCPGRTRPRK